MSIKNISYYSLKFDNFSVPKIILIFSLSVALMACDDERASVIETSASGNCAELSNLNLSHAVITKAETIPAGDYMAPDGKSYVVPAFCRVHAVAVPTESSHINFEVWMPLGENWNGRYYQVGNGGFSGKIMYSLMANILKNGNAVASTDDGHVKQQGVDASWALNEPEKIIDYGYRSLKETSDHSRMLITAFYDRKPDHAYFSGCSTGGRQALMVAQRWPDEWDAVLVGAPVNDFMRTYSSKSPGAKRWFTHPEGRIPSEKLPAIQKAALASCTAEAHVLDGIATDPRFCPFDPAALACSSGKDTAECLTSPQIITLRQIYNGSKYPDTGKTIFPGMPPTIEAIKGWSAWNSGYVKDTKTGPTIFAMFTTEFFQNFVFNDPNWKMENFDFKRDMQYRDDVRLQGQSLFDILDSSEADLTPFQKKGGKIIMYHGWGDAALSALGGIDYYERVTAAMGGQKATEDFYRLFMVPGMAHCAGGPGTNSFGRYASTPPLHGRERPDDDGNYDIMRALEAWVEKDIAPEKIIATKYVDDKPEKGVAFTRPLCPYPQIAIYKGDGDINEARNFECKEGG